MKGRVLLIAGLVVLCINLVSGNDIWYEGVIILNNNEVLVGDISYNSENDIVQIKQENKIFTLSAFQVSSFNFHDTSLKAIRRFVSLPYEKISGRYVDIFFEVIIRNEVSLIRKRNPYQSNNNYYISDSGDDFTSQKNDYDYFFEYKGLIVPSNRFKRELKPLLNLTMESEINGFIKDNNLNLNRTYDQVIVVRYFNKMFNSYSEKFLTSY